MFSENRVMRKKWLRIPSFKKIQAGLIGFSRTVTGLTRLLALMCTLFLIIVSSQNSVLSSSSEIKREIETRSGTRIRFLDENTYQIATDSQTFSEEIEIQNEIKLRNRTFDPAVNRDPRLVEKDDLGKHPRSRDQASAWLVQFTTLPMDDYRDEISRLGGQLFNYIPNQTYIVLMNDEVQQRVDRLSYVRWTGPYRAEYKLDTSMGVNPDADLKKSVRQTKKRYSIMVLERGADMQNELAAFIESINGTVELTTPEGTRLEATLTESQVASVAKRPETLFIDLWSEPEIDVNFARDAGGANYVESVAGYTGAGVRGEVMDTGFFPTHEQFQAIPPIVLNNSFDRIYHGTSAYGIVFGSGEGNANARGLLPGAQGIFSSAHNLNNRYAHTAQLVDPSGDLRAVFQTNSWGYDETTYYSTITSEMDDIIFQNDILILQSQGNRGNRFSRPQAWAKNIVSVGGYRHYNTISIGDDRWQYSASIGPAPDGRIKPDLSFYYDATLAPTTPNTDSYRNDFGGTSGATPLTAGHFGLFFQMWADGVFEGTTGLNRDVFDSRPHASTAKAVMINTASQHPFSGTAADMTRTHQGWGTVSVQTAYDVAMEGRMPILINETDPLVQGEKNTYNVNIPKTNCPLRATMVYLDPAAAPSAQIHRVNDLNLRLIAPDGTRFWGNFGLDSGNWSQSGGSANDVDTVENVFVQSPQVGDWTIEVIGQSIPQDARIETPIIDADYALVVTTECDDQPYSSCSVIEVPQYEQEVDPVSDWSAIPTIPYTTESAFYNDMSVTNQTSTDRTHYSGVTHDMVSDSLLIVDDEDNVIDVYDENAQLINTISVDFVSDLEDIFWMSGNYVLVDEATNELHVVSIPDIKQTSSLTTSDIVYTIDTCLPHGINGEGIEGATVGLWSVGTNATFFYVLWEGEDEGDPQIYEYRRFRDDDNDETNNPIYRFGPVHLGNVVGDVAAIYTPISEIDALYVLSEQSKRIIRLNSFYSAQVTGTFSLTNFGRPEGLYFNLLMEEMYVVGHSRQLGIYTP